MTSPHRLAFRRTPSGLLVPFVPNGEGKTGDLPEARFMLTTVGLAELFHQALPIAHVVALLKRYSLQQVLV